MSLNGMSLNDMGLDEIGLDDDWSNYLHNQTTHSETKNVLKRTNIDIPICDEISISTKTKIIYFNVYIDLFKRFWDFPMIDYDSHSEGIIKKQIKFNFTNKAEVENFYEYVKKEPRIIQDNIYDVNHPNIHTLNQIDNPNGRIKFKDIKKIDIGICKNDLIKQKKRTKSAFYNCYVLIYRVKLNDKFKEIHIKMFNTGKIEIPGIQSDNMIDIAVDRIKQLLQPHYAYSVKEEFSKRDTILVNSNFSCNYYINRDELFKILKKTYHVKCSYDPCSYPGIQCKYKLDSGEISFMIFRTGSVLIVGKCENEELFMIYEFIKNIFHKEYMNIYEINNEIKQKKNKKKIKKIIYIEE
jgi:TATA-box binding protein (TBP) (component of TFIID and TFIIIB)